MTPSTRHFFSIFAKENEAFRDVNEQQDAHEFLRTLFNCLDDAALTPFWMELETRINCLECKREHARIEKALDISVMTDCFDVPLEERFESFNLDADEHESKAFRTKQDVEKYACEQCKQETNARLVRTIRALPRDYLILHFNRFVRRKRGWQKDSTTLDLPTNLRLKEGIHPEGIARFELFAIVEHQGQSMDSGHYIAIIRKDAIRDDDELMHDWYWISDDRVRCVKRDDKSAGMKGRQPYVAFYSRVEDQ